MGAPVCVKLWLWSRPGLISVVLQNCAVAESVVSNTGMRPMILTFWFALFACSLWAQQAADKPEKAAIQRAKNVLVSSLDSSLPKVSLEFFLNYEAGGAPIQWEVNDCGQQSRKPSTDRGTDPPCALQPASQKIRLVSLSWF